jgi:hypothetical protein
MRLWLALGFCTLFACSGKDDELDTIIPAVDGGARAADAGPGGVADASLPVDAAVGIDAPGADAWVTPSETGEGRAGATCRTGADCRGGVCLGAPGQPEEGNPRFTGGYCTARGCVPDTQTGCGADEICVDLGGGIGGACVAMCSKSDGLTCARTDHVCVGIGAWGGCFSEDVIECTVRPAEGCAEGTTCVAIGFDDQNIGRCERLCDIFDPDSCGPRHDCAYIRKYNVGICGSPGTQPPEASCSCDKCCVRGYGCTPDLDGVGRHCKKLCRVATGEGCNQGERCEPLDIDGSRASEVGGCIAPGSAGT